VARTAVEIACQAWVAAAVPLIPVIFANQASPRPARPYITVAVTTDKALSATPHIVTTTTPSGDGRHFDQERSWSRRGTVRLEFYGTPASARSVEYSFQDDAIIALLDASGLTVGRVLSSVDESVVRDTSWEGRVVVDFQISYRDTVVAPVDTIDTCDNDLTFEDPT